MRLPLLFLALALAARAGEPFDGLKARAAACGEGLRSQACGPASPKGREARILYGQARSRNNALLELLAGDLRAGALEPGALDQARAAEAAGALLVSYLELARCDGTTAAPEGDSAPRDLLTGLPGLVQKALGTPGAQKLADDLEALRWPELGPAGAKGAEALPPRYLVQKGGFHTAPIRQMALDAREEILVTASEDKTVRLWDPRTLACLRVLRPPMGPGDCGKLYAAVLSADGRTVVASGFTRDPEGGGHRLYVMDARDGRLLLEIPGLPQVVNRLSLSPDGATVVVHLGERMGLRWYRLADGAEVGRDPLYGGPSYAGTFAADGRYAATSDDGFVRVYSKDLRLLAKARTPAPGPYGVAFSPDGATLALGYADGCRVDLLSAKTLFPSGKVDTRGCLGPLGVVAWSLDGSKLYACGGQDFGPLPNAVYCWAEGGKGTRSEAQAASATLSDLLPTRDGGLLVAAQDPKLCRFGPGLALTAVAAAATGSMSQAREGLRVDAAGGTVALGWRYPGCAFSIPALGLQDRSEGLVGPLREGAGLKVQGWLDGERPTLNGQPLQGLEPHEVVRSLSLARNAQGFALGTDWCLRYFDARGRMLHATPLPAACWGLNHAPGGRVLVAALADGSIRWYDLEGGELMALALSADGQRWALWNAAGYFDASIGGEGLLGWQVQREGEEGAFFPLSHFRDRCCRPDLFQTLLARGGLARTLAGMGLPADPARPELALALPPQVRILAPAPGAPVGKGSTSFRVAVRSSGPPEQVRAWHLYVDGEKLQDPSGTLVKTEGAAEEFRLELPLPGHACRVSLVVETGTRVSEPAHVNLADPGGPAPAARPPVLNLLTIGISAYRQPGLRLLYPAKDARDVADLFMGQKDRLYSTLRTRTLVDGEATREAILKALREVRDQSSPFDVTLLFLSGHGLTGPAGGYCFLPFDAEPRDEATLVAGQELKDILARTQGKVVLMLDTCHAGGVLGEGGMRGLDETLKFTRFINELTSADNGVMVFSSSTGRQLSLESPEWGNGAFTKALREGLGGKADPGGSGRVTLANLDTWLRGRVKDLTRGAQTPVTARPATAVDFPLVVLP